ncbi:hypothetical protein RZS08_00450, partial [Arthrospira platensis SPKY1]|nr:hypothetical protein [Arthrospira platensis SPKY1]
MGGAGWGSARFGDRDDLVALLEGDTDEHEGDAGAVEQRRALAEGDPADEDRRDRERGEQHAEPADRDAAQHELVDAVADRV